MSTRRRSKSPDRTIPARALAAALRILPGALALATASVAEAYVTVGPNGTYATIQGGVNQALANGGDEVRVEVKLCTDVHGFQYVCAFKENIILAANHSVTLSGGWQSDFQTPSANRTWVQGAGASLETLRLLLETGGVTIDVSGFDFNGSGTAADGNTRAVRVDALAPGLQVNIHDNTLRNNALLATGPVGLYGGGGVWVQAQQGAMIMVQDNTFQSNSVYGGGSGGTFGGAASLWIGDGSQASFTGNVITGNFISNADGGACHGGAVFAGASGPGTNLTLSGNNWTSNQQFGCSSGATGDAAEIHSSYSATVHISDELWQSNAAANDPGVYEVFMHADNYGAIYAGNALITHGTWGGLYAQTDATAVLKVVNFTIADNPVLGFNGVGPGTQLWNTILWNDGSPISTSGGATANNYLSSDPLFVDSANGNYRLNPNSPAINAGHNVIPNATFSSDLDGSPRPYAGDCRAIADIGAYEFHSQGDRVFCSAFE